MTAPNPSYVDCQLVRVKDADTFILKPNFERATNFELVKPEVCRLRDYNAAELSTVLGKEQKAAAEAIFEASDIQIEAKGRDKYGRLLVWVWVGGQSLGQLLELGPYPA